MSSLQENIETLYRIDAMITQMMLSLNDLQTKKSVLVKNIQRECPHNDVKLVYECGDDRRHIECTTCNSWLIHSGTSYIHRNRI